MGSCSSKPSVIPESPATLATSSSSSCPGGVADSSRSPSRTNAVPEPSSRMNVDRDGQVTTRSGRGCGRDSSQAPPNGTRTPIVHTRITTTRALGGEEEGVAEGNGGMNTIHIIDDENSDDDGVLESQRESDSHYRKKPQGQESYHLEEALAISKAMANSEQEINTQQLQRDQLGEVGGTLSSEDADLAKALQESSNEFKRKKSKEDEDLAKALETSELDQNDANHDQAADRALAHAIETSENQFHVEQMAEYSAFSTLSIKRARTEDRYQGSWDCSVCTYTNQPYQDQCAVCSNTPPPDVLTFTKMPRVRYGLEIEIIIPDGKRDGYTYEWIAAELKKLGPPDVEFKRYTHKTTPYWKIVTDSSLKGASDDDLCFELVSPVLQGDGIDGLGSLRAIMENIRKIGVATNASCGFHVHVDASRNIDEVGQLLPSMGTLGGLKRVAQCFVALENAFDLLVELSWDSTKANSSGHNAVSDTNERYDDANNLDVQDSEAPPTACRSANSNKYCKSNRIAFDIMSNKQTWDRIAASKNRKELINLLNPDFDRYRKLNLTNITKPKRPSTVEFRQHGGVEELQETEAWVRLLLRFCEQASYRTPNSDACLLPEDSTPKQELEALFKLIDDPGLEQFFVVDRRLFQDERLSNEWECNICHKKFANPRALAQHTQAKHAPPQQHEYECQTCGWIFNSQDALTQHTERNGH